MSNTHQMLLAWMMYGNDNNDVLAPNDYPLHGCAYATAGAKQQNEMKNWVVGTMEAGH